MFVFNYFKWWWLWRSLQFSSKKPSTLYYGLLFDLYVFLYFSLPLLYPIHILNKIRLKIMTPILKDSVLSLLHKTQITYIIVVLHIIDIVFSVYLFSPSYHSITRMWCVLYRMIVNFRQTLINFNTWYLGPRWWLFF